MTLENGFRKPENVVQLVASLGYPIVHFDSHKALNLQHLNLQHLGLQ